MDEAKKENTEGKQDNSVKEIKHESLNANGSETNLTSKIRENPWIVATAVLAIVVIILLVGDFTGGGTGASVAVADSGAVQQKVLDFVNSQVDEPVEVVDTNLKNGLYEVVILYQGQNIPIYVTADGINLVQGVTPIDQLIAAANSQTDTQNTPEQTTTVPKSDKPVVDLFVMSMCPYGTQAEKGILPVLMKLGDKIDFNLRFVSYAMHGKDEVDENTVQYCIQKNEPEKLYGYLECYLDGSDPTHWDSCLTTVGIDKTKLDSCVDSADTEFKINEMYEDKDSWSGGRYPQYLVDKELNTEYGVRGSPTLIINGVQSNAGRSPASYLAGICAAFNTAPEECTLEMPSTTPGPGFGWDTESASATAAQCG